MEKKITVAAAVIRKSRMHIQEMTSPAGGFQRGGC